MKEGGKDGPLPEDIVKVVRMSVLETVIMQGAFLACASFIFTLPSSQEVLGRVVLAIAALPMVLTSGFDMVWWLWMCREWLRPHKVPTMKTGIFITATIMLIFALAMTMLIYALWTIGYLRGVPNTEVLDPRIRAALTHTDGSLTLIAAVGIFFAADAQPATNVV